MKHLKYPLSIAVALLASPAYGAVTLQDSYSAGAPGGAPSDLGGVFGYEFTLNPVTEFSAAGHDKMVLVLSGHDGQLGNGSTSVTSVTYNGVAMTQAIQDGDNGSLVTAGIFYLDNVVSDGALRIELSSGRLRDNGFGLYALDGTKAGVQDTGTARTDLTTATVTITTDSGFYVQEATRNNQTLSGSVDDFQTLYGYSVNSYRSLSQYQLTTAAGDYNAPINNGGVNYRRVVAAAFEAAPVVVIPEPSSAALLGLGGLALILRRRK